MRTNKTNYTSSISQWFLSPCLAIAIYISSFQAACAQATTEIRHDITNWLECGICDEDELAPVKARGKTDIETVKALATALRDGPADGEIEVLRSNLLIAYRKLSSPKQTREAFTKTYLDKYLDGYRIRAAKALGAIGTEESMKVLADAQKKHLSTSVRNAVNDALNNPK